jgi:hypothetical protein
LPLAILGFLVIAGSGSLGCALKDALGEADRSHGYEPVTDEDKTFHI